MRVFAAAAAMLAGTFASAGGNQPGLAFPGDKDELISPDGTMKVVNRDPEDGQDMHSLILVRTGEGERVIHRYRRHVTVGWAPAGAHFFITDYAESTDATCLVVDGKTHAKIDLRKDVGPLPKGIASVLANPHAYLECEKWLSDTEILLSVSGWGGDESPQRQSLIKYSLRHGFAR